MKKILIQGDHFVDEDGRQVLFNGINVVCKDPEQEYLYDADAKRFTLSYLAEADGTTIVYCPFRPEKVQAGSPITWETKMLADQACLVSLKADKVGEMTVTIA